MRGGNALEPLVSCKLVKGDLRSEGSETTNSGPDPTATLRTGQVGTEYERLERWIANRCIQPVPIKIGTGCIQRWCEGVYSAI